MANAVKIENRFLDERTVYILPDGGDNQYVGFLANALARAASEGYRLVSAEEDSALGAVLLKFTREKHDKPAPVMRKAR